MNTELFNQLENTGYTRNTLNIFINPAVTTQNTKNRDISTLDMFPTTLASIGATFSTNRLGLGTNLFSDEETIVKRLGLDYVSSELQKVSKFYNKNFVYTKK